MNLKNKFILPHFPRAPKSTASARVVQNMHLNNTSPGNFGKSLKADVNCGMSLVKIL
jgi:hypothetical protein